MELFIMNVGDYVRIKTLSGQGKIAKLEKIDDICITDTGAIDKNNIIKSSPQITDLIEKNDLITLTSEYCKDEVYRVVGILKGVIELDLFEDGTMQIGNDDIKTVVTHEQMEAMQYRVEK